MVCAMIASAPGTVDWRDFSGSPLVDPVLDAACAAFVEVGYHGTTVRDIARRAHLSVPGLYHHHLSKQSMLVSIFDAVVSEVQWRFLAAAEEAGDDPVTRLESFVTALALFGCHHVGPALIAATEMRSLELPHRRRITTERTELQRMVDEAVLEGAASGMFRVDHPVDASRAVVTMTLAVPNWYRPRQELGPEDVAERYAAYALGLLGYFDD
jgi:AcrR family transcriptional regulator